MAAALGDVDADALMQRRRRRRPHHRLDERRHLAAHHLGAPGPARPGASGGTATWRRRRAARRRGPRHRRCPAGDRPRPRAPGRRHGRHQRHRHRPGSLERLAAEAPPMPDPWPLEARQRLTELLLSGPPAVGIIEALDQRGLWTRVLPEWEHTRSQPAAQRLPPLHGRPAPGGGRRRGGRPRRPGRPARPPRDRHPAARHRQGPARRSHGRRHGAGAHDRHADGLPGRRRRHARRPWSSTTCCCPTSPPGATSTTPARSTSSPRRSATCRPSQLLAALTEGDSLATGPAAWGGWKAQLVSGAGRAHRPRARRRTPRRRAAGPVPHRRAPRPDGRRRAGPRRPGRHPHRGHGRQARACSPRSPACSPCTGLGVLDANAFSSDEGVGPGPVPGRVELRSGDPVGPRHRRPRQGLRRAASPSPPDSTSGPAPTHEAVVAADAGAHGGRLRQPGLGGRHRHRRAGPRLGRPAPPDHQALAELDLDIRSAKVSTIGPQVVDAFYVAPRGREAHRRRVPSGGRAGDPPPASEPTADRCEGSDAAQR